MHTTRIDGGLKMWKDPVVEETRRLRTELSREFNDDSRALLDYIKEKDKKRGKKVISRPSRPVISEKKAN
jgi:hypothetical protein